MVKLKKLVVVLFIGLLGLILLASSGCSNTEAKQPAPQPLPVNTQTVTLTPVPRLDDYVATVKSRPSATTHTHRDRARTRLRRTSPRPLRLAPASLTLLPHKPPP